MRGFTAMPDNLTTAAKTGPYSGSATIADEDFVLEIDLVDEAATAALAANLARIARPHDVLALSGDLGSGKTAFARAFVRASGAGAEVPSPTFTLVQAYDGNAGPIHHFDLFRLTSPEETDELAMDEAFADGICLIEWPDRMGARLPAERLDIEFGPGPDAGARCVRLSAHGAWRRRLGEAGLG
jgi:tRNA threonylcarbamoyl adenosine modification protein YjeE